MPTSYRTRMTLFNAVAVASTGNAESPVVPLGTIAFIEGLVVRAASVTGNASVKLEYATSPDGTNFESFDDTTDIITASASEKPGNPEGFNAYNMAAYAPGNGYIKFKVTGVGANPADTLVTAYLYAAEGTR